MGGLLLLLLAGGTIYLVSRPANAEADLSPWYDYGDDITGGDPAGAVDVDVELVSPGEGISDADYIAMIRAAGLNPADYGLEDPAGETGEVLTVEEKQTRNLTAFLQMTRQVESEDDYTSLVGGGSFSDMSDHPANLGWPGIRRSDGRKTTAAGAYQITQTTWNDIAPRLGLTDFTEASQDAAAVGLIQRRRAYELVLAGQFEPAMRKLVSEWEAFARMFAGNYPISIEQALASISDSGGTFA